MIFITTDPQGYEIQMTDECWYKHILIEHPEMANCLDDIKQAIETPDYIYESKYRSSSHLYFLNVLDEDSETEYILVVVSIRQKNRKGYIQTAFLVDRVSKGGKLLWKRI
jgi:hypothetical protein